MISLYSVAALSGALLLFLIQPMFAKMTLPLMGGTPAVWNTAMVFYQVVLLLGYAYVHFSTRFLDIRQSAVLHMVLLLAAFLFLPVAVVDIPPPTASAVNTAWLLKVYALSIGVPFFLVSTIAPLLQKWFSQTSNQYASNPYFLYSASNVGSILSLLAYPVLLEPYIGLRQQGYFWSYIFVILVILLAACLWALFRNYEPKATQVRIADGTPLSQKLRWMAMAFIPSSLMLSVTTHITTDLGSSPFMWIIPLTLFLLTFVIVFARKPVLPHYWMVKSQSYLMLLAPIILFQQFSDFRIYLALHLLIFFICAMVCHGELVKIKPAAEKLTEFYFFMSIGGALGGIFTAIVAPSVFNSVYEYPIGFVLACLARPILQDGKSGKQWNDFLLPVLLWGVLYLVVTYGISSGVEASTRTVLLKILMLVSALVVFSFSPRPVRFGLGIAVLIYLGAASTTNTVQTLETHRNFFGVQKIQAQPDSNLLLLRHGTTIHGVQHADPARRTEPLSYYYKDGPVGTVFRELNQLDQLETVGIVGLGLGTLSCYGEDGQNWRIFEIDDLVVSIARNTKYFHHLELCAPEAPIIIGDARLSMKKESDGFYDLLVIDAFSSDAIPVHLLTREALALYMEKLSDRGRLLMHISNRHLNLAPVLGNLAHQGNYPARIQFYTGDSENYLLNQSAIWLVMGKSEKAIDFLSSREEWQALPTDPSVGYWSDDFSNLFRSLIWHQR